MSAIGLTLISQKSYKWPSKVITFHKNDCPENFGKFSETHSLAYDFTKNQRPASNFNKNKNKKLIFLRFRTSI